MRQIALVSLVSLGLTIPAMAQVPAGANPATGARPGNDIGTGQSLPTSNNASNITPSTTRSPIAPRLPAPNVANDTPRGYLIAARQALSAGRTGEAQEALERAESRLLDRSVAPSRADEPIRGPRIADVTAARDALAGGNRAAAIAAIDGALNRPQ